MALCDLKGVMDLHISVGVGVVFMVSYVRLVPGGVVRGPTRVTRTAIRLGQNSSQQGMPRPSPLGPRRADKFTNALIAWEAGVGVGVGVDEVD
jgi:hypothetical protein